MMKKVSIFLTLLTMLLLIGGCISNDNDIDIKPEREDYNHNVYFDNIADFKNYISDIENQNKDRFIDANVYIEFDSIIPNSEVAEISVIGNNAYGMEYVFTKGVGYLKVDIVYPPDETVAGSAAETIQKHPDTINHTPYDSLTVLEDINEKTQNIWIDLGEYEIMYIRDVEIQRCWFVIDDYWFHMYITNFNSPAQEIFVKALNPDLGATDDSVIAMLDRIKALIPTSEDSYDYEPDNVCGDASGAVSSNDGSSTTDQTSGETNEDTDYGDDYLYEDNDVPTIPGISPDWKPNENGKYPLKDGYTKYELTLILACEIELDFGDMTDEEISKLEFRLIEEDAEE